MNSKELWKKLDEMKEMMGADNLLDEIARGLSSQELYEALEYVDRMHGLGLFEEEEEEEESEE